MLLVYQTVCVLSHFSRVQLCATLWTVARQAPLSMGFSRQEYWSGLPCPPPEDLPDSGIEPTCPTSPALAGVFFTTSVSPEVLYQPTLTLILPKQEQSLCLDIPSQCLQALVPRWKVGQEGQRLEMEPDSTS